MTSRCIDNYNHIIAFGETGGDIHLVDTTNDFNKVCTFPPLT